MFDIDHKTDFESHHIEGWIGDNKIEVPLISFVTDNLYQGGCIGGVLLPKEIDYIISLYPWEQYKLHAHQVRKEVTMYDHDGLPDLDLLDQLADEVNVRRKEGTVLVHCQAGLNRSGLVAGLALIKSGMTPRDAVALLRKQRCDMVLFNTTFCSYLFSIPSRMP